MKDALRVSEEMHAKTSEVYSVCILPLEAIKAPSTRPEHRFQFLPVSEGPACRNELGGERVTVN